MKVNGAVAPLMRLRRGDVIRARTLSLHAMIVEPGAVADDDLGNGVRPIDFAVEGRVRLHHGCACFAVDHHQVPWMHYDLLILGGSGDEQQLNGLLDEDLRGNVQERAFAHERGVQRAERTILSGGVFAEVLPDDFRLFVERVCQGVQTERVENRGRKSALKKTVHKDEAMGRIIDQEGTDFLEMRDPGCGMR